LRAIARVAITINIGWGGEKKGLIILDKIKFSNRKRWDSWGVKRN